MRQYYLAQELAVRGYSVSTYGVPEPRDADGRAAFGHCEHICGANNGEISARNCDNETKVVDYTMGIPKNAAKDDCIDGMGKYSDETEQDNVDISDKNRNNEDILSFNDGRGSVTVYSELRTALGSCRNIILPFPLSPDGITLNCADEEKPPLRSIFLAISEVCGGSARVYAGAVKERSREIAASFGIEVVDYGAMEEIALENAVPTAEGAIETAMRVMNVTVRGSKFAVIGYGRCGSELARLLKAMGAEVCGIARSGKDRAKMRNDGVADRGFDGLVSAVNGAEITFNTVPFNVFDCHTLSLLDDCRVIVELASAPGGVDRECAARYGVRVIHAPSLPGKYAPKTAARIIARALIPLLD